MNVKCKFCGSIFKANRKDNKFCNTKCYNKNYRKLNKDKILQQQRDYKNINKEKVLLKNREYMKKYRKVKQNKKHRNQYELNKKKNIVEYKVLSNLRIRLWQVLKGRSKSNNTLDLLGCSFEELKEHFEKQFKKGMSWNNYGEWHIDHVLPCASFDLTNEEEQKKCFHYTNLQPLWAIDNLKKGAKILKRKKNEL